jgi:hypothetical protein
MTPGQITLLALLEAVGVFMITRLWHRAPKASLLQRIVWSVLLLIPLLGPILYGFISLDPSVHSEDVGDHSSGGGTRDIGHLS